MDELIIERHLLRAPGESFYRSDRFQREHPDAAKTMGVPIAQLGIGFLSSFMVAKTVEVFTRYYSQTSPTAPIHIELESLDRGVVYYEPDMANFPEGIRSGPGICVRLWLNETLAD